MLLALGCASSSGGVRPHWIGKPKPQVLRPDDPRPDENTTPGASRHAKPAWFDQTPGLIWDTTDGAVPATHVSDAAELFDIGGEYVHEGALRGQLVACRVDVEFSEFKSLALRPGRHDLADLVLHGWVNEDGSEEHATSTTTFGWKESNRGFIAFPLTWMEPGQSLILRMSDRDRIASLDFIEQVSITYDGALPFRHEGERSSVECRVVADRPMHDLAIDACWAIDRLLVDLERKPIDPDTPPERARDFIEAFYGLARLIGWADPRTQKRVAQLEALWPTFPNLPAPPEEE